MTWVACIVTASVPLMRPDWEVYSNSSICVGLPFKGSSEQSAGFGYIRAVHMGINLVIFLIIAAGQIALCLAYRNNTTTGHFVSEQAKRQHRKSVKIARQLFLVVITDFLCWFPIFVMGLLVASDDNTQIPNDAYAWSAVVIMPINAAINPLLYTFRKLLEDVINVCRTRLSQVWDDILDFVATRPAANNETGVENQVDETEV